VVAAGLLVELGQQALADCVGVPGLAEVGPLLDRRIGGGVGDALDVDLALSVDRVVHGHPDRIAPLRERLDNRAATFLPGRAAAEPLGRLTEEEQTLVAAQIPFVRQGAQQVIRRGQREVGLAGQLLGGRPVLVLGGGFQEAHRTLHGSDECRGVRLSGGGVLFWGCGVSSGQGSLPKREGATRAGVSREGSVRRPRGSTPRRIPDFNRPSPLADGLARNFPPPRESLIPVIADRLSATLRKPRRSLLPHTTYCTTCSTRRPTSRFAMTSSP
jgi:hypothetical protein